MSFPPRPARSIVDWSLAIITTLVVAAAIVVFVRDGSERFLTILIEDAALFADVLPKILAGCLIGAFVVRILPRDVIVRWVGANSGLSGLVIATFAGTIFPGGPITIFPVAGAFLAVGADAGAAIAFITSLSLLGYQRALVWELPFFGVDFIVWRLLVSLPLPLIAGLLARWIVNAVPVKVEQK